MVAASVIGLIAYLVLFGDRLRKRHQLKAFAITAAVGFGMGAAVAIALWLIRQGIHTGL